MSGALVGFSLFSFFFSNGDNSFFVFHKGLSLSPVDSNSPCGRHKTPTFGVCMHFPSIHSRRNQSSMGFKVRME